MSPFKSNPANCIASADLLAPLQDGWEYTMIQDASERLTDGSPICAQLTYAGARAALERLGFEMLTADDVEWLHEAAKRGECIEVPAYTGTPTAETSLAMRKVSDEANWQALHAAGWKHGMRWCNWGKGWIAGAPDGRAWLMGWWVKRVEVYGIQARSGNGFIQPRPAPGSRGAHGAHDQADDGTNTWGKRRVDGPPSTRRKSSAPPPAQETTMRSTIRIGSKGPDVVVWQTKALGFTAGAADGAFGNVTSQATKALQRKSGLVDDGVVGAKSWALIGEVHQATAPLKPGANDPRSPACIAILRDANAAWPDRSRISDGIMGDARHQASKSDHNSGNACDVTHDVAHGCDGNVLASMAIKDKRVTYVIWNRRIYSRARSNEGWRPYTGSNGHTHHVHISVREDMRNDSSPWPWAPR